MTLSTVVLAVLMYFGVLPLSSEYAAFYSVLILLFALWRPNLAFLLVVAWLPLEIVTVTPVEWGFTLRPYQWGALLLGVALGIRFLSGRLPGPLFRWGWIDTSLLLLVSGGVLSSVLAEGGTIKPALVLVSFFYIHLLSRIFLRTQSDALTASIFFAVPAGIMLGWAGLQNILFMLGKNPLAVMPGRPNGTLPEPDWLGLFLLLWLPPLLVILARRITPDISRWQRWLWPALGLLALFTVLILTVSRSAWLGALAADGMFFVTYFNVRGRAFRFRESFTLVNVVVVLFGLALLFVTQIPLSRFVLSERAVSTVSTWQTITIACSQTERPPKRIESTTELERYHCEHIPLEERDARHVRGEAVLTVERPDPNVGIRKRIYQAALGYIQMHPVLGIGWGSFGRDFGQDDRGAQYNASNLWLEVWLGTGLIGLMGLLGFLGSAGWFLVRAFRAGHHEVLVTILSAWLAGWLVFSCFNSALLLGFIWVVSALFPLLTPDARGSHASSND